MDPTSSAENLSGWPLGIRENSSERAAIFPSNNATKFGGISFNLTNYRYVPGFDKMGLRDIPKVKNPCPEGPALISPQRDGVYFETSNGMMEWWNNGILLVS